MSTNLSIMALFGLALVPLAPHGAALTRASLAPPPSATSTAQSAVKEDQTPKAPAAPVEMVRAKPVPLSQSALASPPPLRRPLPADLPADDAEADEPQPDASTHILARLSRERRRRRASARAESGEDGKAGASLDSGSLGKAGTEVASAEPPEPPVWSDEEIITGLRDCLKRLAPLAAEIEIAPPVKKDQCGNPAPVLLKRIGSGAGRVEFQPPPMLNCAMVASLHSWVEKTLQPAAEETLGSPIVRVRGAAGYACRNRNGTRAQGDRLSEHAHANAIDIMGFVTADGRTIDLLSKWGPTERDIREQKERLAEAKAAARRAAKEAVEEAMEAAHLAEKEVAEAVRAVAKLPASKRKKAKAEADRKKKEAERKAEEVERKREEAQELEAELRGTTVRTAGLQKLGRGIDSKDVRRTGTDGDDRPSAEGTFLRRLHKGACSTFGTVLGPEANEAHRNHFHFDLAPRRRRGYCE